MQQGLAFYLGVGLSLLGILYTVMVFVLRDEIYGGKRGPYLVNGIVLCVLGLSLVGRELFLPRPLVWVIWGICAYVEIQVTRTIVANRPDAPVSPHPPTPSPVRRARGRR